MSRTLLLLLLATACAKNETFVDPTDGGEDTIDDTAPPIIVSDGPANTCDTSGVSCSPDMHSVIDCNGGAIQKCADTEGCADGKCIPACDAAIQNKTTMGCDYEPFAPDYGCYTVFIANTWNAPVTITVEKGGTTVNVTNFARIPKGTGTSLTYDPLPGGVLPADQVALLFLAGNSTDCPVAAAQTGYLSVGTGYGDAYLIHTSAPVVAYSIVPYAGGDSYVTGASMLFPTSAWDTDYVGVTPRPLGSNTTNPRLEIVGMQNGTTVTINPVVDIVAGTGVAAATKGVPKNYSLSRGQVLRFTQADDLAGSAISADKAIGVYGSQGCINIGSCCCDGQHQEIPPVRALGHEYVGARYRERVDGNDEAARWRLVGAVNGTTLSYDPAPPTGAPTSINKGDVKEFDSPGPFSVTSQDKDHPFYFVSYMTGGSDYQSRGDPEMVTVIPAQQYLQNYVFFTDPTYPDTNLVFVRRAASDNQFKDVDLDCFGNLTGWKPIGKGGKYQFTRADLSKGNFEKQGKCDNGRHLAKSDGPFSLTVWGWGSQEASAHNHTSYGYPAGAAAHSINTVVVNPK